MINCVTQRSVTPGGFRISRLPLLLAATLLMSTWAMSQVTSVNVVPSTPQVRCTGQSIAFSLAVVGTGPFTYQWTRDTGGGPVDIPSATGPTYSIGSVSLSDEGTYNCKVTFGMDPAVTDPTPTFLDVQQPAQILTQPMDAPICVGTTVMITLTYTGDPAPSVVWKKGPTTIMDGPTGNGSTYAITTGMGTSTLAISNAQNADAGSYTATISNVCGTGTFTEVSDPAVLSADLTGPTFTNVMDMNLFVDSGICTATFSFTPMATDDCGVATISPAVNANLAPGTYPYNFTATDTAGNMTNASMMVTVVDNQLPVLTVPAAPVFVIAAGPTAVTFSVTATDNCMPAPVVVCTPPSGSVFPAGRTTVNCTATDAYGNMSSDMFDVFVCVNPPAPTTVYVDDDWAGMPNGTDVGSMRTIGCDAFATIQAGINTVATSGTVNVAAGSYNEDVAVNKACFVQGAGAGSSIVSGPLGGDGATFRFTSLGATIDGFTITRDGNNVAQWNDGTLNFAGVAVQGLTVGGTLQNCHITGNRTGIDVNNTNGMVIRNNVFENNHTGMIFRNSTTNTVLTENAIFDNRTVGVLFLDASGGTNSPVQSAINSTFSGNAIYGNWYGQIVDRQSGGSLPAPGTTNLKNFSTNWLGSTTPVITTANSAELPYAMLIPIVFGGTATAPGGQPDVAGPASANFDITPLFESGTDTDIDLGNGTYGFQGDYTTLTVTDELAQTGATNRVQEGIDTVTNSTVHITAGTFTGNVVVNKKVELIGVGDGADPMADTILTVTSGNVMNFTASGMSAMDRILVQSLRIVGVGSNGLYFDAPVSFITIDDVTSTGCSNGLEVHNAAAITDLILDDVHLDGNTIGLRVATTGAVDGLSVVNGSMSNNSYGCLINANLSVTNNEDGFKNISMNGTTFANDVEKGLYFEKLSGATFTDIVVTNCGTSPTFPSGCDINLKRGNYLAATFTNLQISGSGIGSASGNSFASKTRNDGPNSPTSFAGVYLSGGSVSGAPFGLSLASNARVEGMTLTGSLGAAVVVYAEGAVNPLVDLGNCDGVDYSGLGASTGGNVLTGYGFDDAAPFAVASGIVSGGPAVYAQNNDYGVMAGNNVELLLSDDTDNPAFAGVLAAQSGPFVIDCPDDLMLECAASVPAAATTFDAFLAQGGFTNDNSVVVTSNDVISGTVPSDYVIMRTYTLTGDCGSDMCTQTITVQDILAPVPSIAMLPPLTGECSVVVGSAPTALDNCAGLVNGMTADPLVYNSQGTFTITWTYDDGNGNMSMQTQMVIVDDVTAPVPDVAMLPNVVGECSAMIASAPTATDNCVGSVTGTTSDPLSYAVQGTYMVTWSFNDGNGNVTMQTQTVIVDDVTGPTPDVAMLPDVVGQCMATIGSAPTATDNCVGSVTGITTDPTTYTTQGTFTVTWSYNDGNGNITTQTQTVIVDDTMAPMLTCPSSVMISHLAPRDPYATGVATAVDNCSATPVVTYTDDRSNLDECNTTGFIVRTWSATDDEGNTSTCMQTITIEDTTAPELTACPSDIAGETDAGLCTSVETYVDPTALDVGFVESFEAAGYMPGSYPTIPSTSWNDYASTITQVASGFMGVPSSHGSSHAVINSTSLPPSPDDFSGAFSRQGGYSNVFGNGYTSRVDIYIDLTDPTITGATPLTGFGFDVSAASNNTSGGHRRDFIFHAASYGPGGVTIAASNNSSFTRRNDLLSVMPNATLTSSGWYTFEWVFRDNGSGVLAVDMNVRDAMGAIVFTTTRSDPSDVIGTTVGGNRYMWFTFLEVPFLHIDNTRLTRPVAVTCLPASGSAFAKGTTTVTCSATDDCGVTGTCTFDVDIIDLQVPIADVAPLAVATGECSVSVSAPTATDNCDGTITGTTTDPTVYTAQGTYTINWTYTDSDGNMSFQSQMVVVDDVTAPVPDAMMLADVTGECSAVVVGVPTATDNCEGAIVGTTADPLMYATQGTFVVTWSFDDGNGNVSTQTQTVIVDDVTPPVPDAGSLPTLMDECSVTVSSTPTATDNCEGTIVGTTTDPLSYSTQGSFTITWSFNDGNGNISTQTQMVVIDDVTPPTLGPCPADIVATAPTGACGTNVTWTPPSVSDNCSGVMLTSDHAPGSSFNSGVTTVTYLATDVGGNTAMCSFTVTVVSDWKPVETYSTMGAAVDVAAADMGTVGSSSPDGFTDLVTCTASGYVSIYYNDGSNDFDALTPTHFLYGSGTPAAMVLADFDQDSQTDIGVVLVDGGTTRLSILRNDSGALSQILTRTFTSVAPSAIAAGDLDGNGFPDVVITARGTGPSFTNSAVHIVRQMVFDGSNAATITAPTIAGLSIPIDVVIADLDSDGDFDFAIADEGLGVRLFRVGNAPFSVTGAGTLTGVASNVALATGDIDGDGVADDLVLGANRLAPPASVVSVFINTGNIGSPVVLSTALFGPREDAIDPSGFGLVDVVVSDLQSDTVYASTIGNEALRCANDIVLLRDASPSGDYLGQYLRYNCSAPGVFENFATCDFVDNPTAVAAVDLNGDFIPDVVTSNAGDSSLKVMCAVVRAIGDPFGHPCPVSGYPFIPMITANPLPVEGQVCSINLAGAPPSTGCVLGLSAFQLESQISPTCILYLGFPIYLLPTPAGLVTDGMGMANFSFLVPPGFIGATVYCQWAVFDGGAPDGFSLSAGLHLRLGY